MMDMPSASSEELGVLLGKVHPGEPVEVGEVSIVPLLSGDPGPDAVLLEEALETSCAVVEELGEAGSVQEVKVTYTGPGMLLLLDGEEILGAKQNRIFNASFLVASGPPVIIPVSCVEQGRWKYTSKRFSSSGRTLSSRARSAKLQRVHRSMLTTQSYDADQGAVWSDVEDVLERTHTRSASRAYADAAQAHTETVESRLEDLAPLPEQQGLAVVQGAQVLSLDLFGSPKLYRRAWQKIARGILFEAFEPGHHPGDPRQALAELLSSAARVEVMRANAPGAGETLHGEGAGYVLGAVTHQGAVYHLEIAASG